MGLCGGEDVGEGGGCGAVKWGRVRLAGILSDYDGKITVIN